MFGRRVFGSSQIPRAMYGALRISTPLQARRMLPMLIPIVPSMGFTSGTGQPGALEAISESRSPASIDGVELSPAVVRQMLSTLILQFGFLRLLELWGVGHFPVIGAQQSKMHIY